MSKTCLTATVTLGGFAADPADKLFVVAGILFSVLSAFLVLHDADRIFRKIGRTGTRAIGRVMGLVLAAIGVQFVIDGVVGAAALKGSLG